MKPAASELFLLYVFRWRRLHKWAEPYSKRSLVLVYVMTATDGELSGAPANGHAQVGTPGHASGVGQLR